MTCAEFRACCERRAERMTNAEFLYAYLHREDCAHCQRWFQEDFRQNVHVDGPLIMHALSRIEAVFSDPELRSDIPVDDPPLPG